MTQVSIRPAVLGGHLAHEDGPQVLRVVHRALQSGRDGPAPVLGASGGPGRGGLQQTDHLDPVVPLAPDDVVAQVVVRPPVPRPPGLHLRPGEDHPRPAGPGELPPARLPQGLRGAEDAVLVHRGPGREGHDAPVAPVRGAHGVHPVALLGEEVPYPLDERGDRIGGAAADAPLGALDGRAGVAEGRPAPLREHLPGPPGDGAGEADQDDQGDDVGDEEGEGLQAAHPGSVSTSYPLCATIWRRCRRRAAQGAQPDEVREKRLEQLYARWEQFATEYAAARERTDEELMTNLRGLMLLIKREIKRLGGAPAGVPRRGEPPGRPLGGRALAWGGALRLPPGGES